MKKFIVGKNRLEEDSNYKINQQASTAHPDLQSMCVYFLKYLVVQILCNNFKSHFTKVDVVII